MDEVIQKKLQEVSIDVSTALERFMNNEAMYLKYLRKFSVNPTFSELEKAIEDNDCSASFSASHSLKGNTGTLGINSLYALFTKQADYFRNGEFEKGAKMQAEIKEEYSKVLSILSAI